MVKRSVTMLVDDIDGTALDRTSGETVLFAIDGRAYEIDLTNENASILREALRPFMDAGRKARGKTPKKKRRRTVAA
ncbi:hypothetical protein BWO91_17605 [Plantibacter flavus]|uniref:Lsr2 dimerization domain-containing protein n=1 Tax=Plantibacter flavus TaxID=150123 RepID=UPI0009C2A064|nr:histone-like nucleoid-structuring protein Lsr2 [Plantibacter flavus]AQX81537.1 hypothetical protein BWO91_17605 [Plantibacter flavus]